MQTSTRQTKPTLLRHSSGHKLNKSSAIMTRETVFPCCAEGRIKTDVFADPCWTPPSFFSPQLTLFSSESLKPPADTLSSCLRARQADGGQKTTQLSEERAEEENLPRSHFRLHISQSISVSAYSCLSHLAVTVMPKADFTSWPEGMSSCFPRGLQ